MRIEGHMCGAVFTIASKHWAALAYNKPEGGTRFLPVGTSVTVRIVKQWYDYETGWIMHGKPVKGSDPSLPERIMFHPESDSILGILESRLGKVEVRGGRVVFVGDPMKVRESLSPMARPGKPRRQRLKRGVSA